MPGIQSIVDLVTWTDSQFAGYKTDRYHETELQSEFLDTSFEALGWDKRNAANVNKEYRDFILEQSVKIGREAKPTDYRFKICNKSTFFIETEKTPATFETGSMSHHPPNKNTSSVRLPLPINRSMSKSINFPILSPKRFSLFSVPRRTNGTTSICLYSSVWSTNDLF